MSGTPPYKFESIGDPLPEGLHLTPSGRIVGKPEEEGNTIILVFITDAAGCTLGVAYDLTVNPEP